MSHTSKSRLQTIRQLCELELARVDSVLLSKKPHHKPMLDTYRGIGIGLGKVLVLLDDIAPARYNEGDLLSFYVAARSDGWTVETAKDGEDHWKHAFLYKNGNVAEIDIPGGTLVVYRQDRTQVHEPIPYKSKEYK